MPTIIDALVVTLGLDGGPYKRAAREAAREQAKLKDSVKKGTTEVGDAIKAVAGEAAVLLLGFEGLKGAVNFFAGLNVMSANLGRFSKNIGESAHEVNAWDSAVELAGGTAKEAEADLLALSNSITALKATGDVSPLILLFQRMGVSIYDAQGRTRKLTELYKDLGDRLRQYSRADAFNLAQQAGLSASTFNLIREEASERERILRLAEQNNSVTEDSVAKAAEVQQEWRAIGQTVKGVGIELLGDITPAVQLVFGWVQKLFTGIKNTGFLQGVFSALAGTVRVLVDLVRIAWSGITQLFNMFADTRVGKWLGNLLSKFKAFGAAFVDQADAMADELAPEEKGQKKAAAAPKTKADYRKTIAETEKKYGIPTGVLDKLAKTESNYDPNAVNKKTGATGIVQLLPKYFPNAGWDASADIDTGGKYLLQLYRQFGSWELAAAAYNTGPGNLKKVLAGAKKLPRETRNYVGSIFGPNTNALKAAQFADTQAVPGGGAPSGNTSTMTIDIDQINVNAPNARDANGIAAELPGALRRKGIVAQADSGMS